MLTLMLMVSCERSFSVKQLDGNVILKFSPYDMTTITKASNVSIVEVASKINLMFFNSEGEKVLSQVKTQTKEDSNFGILHLSLNSGTYHLVAVAHSSYNSASIKSLQQVTFTAHEGEKLTDTFYYCGELSVTEEPQTYDIVLKRNIAMFRLVMTDEYIPEEVAKIKFDYTGGSANFNPSTGQGCTKSTQSETRQINDKNIYEIYTFPYLNESGKLKITISALDSENMILATKVFADVPVTANMVTEYKGEFFDGSPLVSSESNFNFVADAEWQKINTFEF